MMSKNSTSTAKKIIKIIVILILAAVLFTALVNIIMYTTGSGKIIGISDIEGDYDCIIVLGAGLRADGSPSNMLEDRIKTGVAILSAGKCNKMIMSGDNSRVEYDEVTSMKNYAVEAGVDSDVIYLDHAGFSTYESMYRAKEIFGVKKAIIVTQKYHLYRALYIAQSLGIEAVGVSADLRTYTNQPIREVREVIARVKDLIYTIIKPQPTYLGEPVSIN